MTPILGRKLCKNTGNRTDLYLEKQNSLLPAMYTRVRPPYNQGELPPPPTVDLS